MALLDDLKSLFQAKTNPLTTKASFMPDWWETRGNADPLRVGAVKDALTGSSFYTLPESVQKALYPTRQQAISRLGEDSYTPYESVITEAMNMPYSRDVFRSNILNAFNTEEPTSTAPAPAAEVQSTPPYIEMFGGNQYGFLTDLMNLFNRKSPQGYGTVGGTLMTSR